MVTCRVRSGYEGGRPSSVGSAPRVHRNQRAHGAENICHRTVRCRDRGRSSGAPPSSRRAGQDTGSTAAVAGTTSQARWTAPSAVVRPETPSPAQATGPSRVGRAGRGPEHQLDVAAGGQARWRHCELQPRPQDRCRRHRSRRVRPPAGIRTTRRCPRGRRVRRGRGLSLARAQAARGRVILYRHISST